MNEKFLITSALLYANGSLHFGHVAGAYLPADCYARFKRLKGNDVFYVSGSDEYGIAITLSAELANREPKEHVDLFHSMNMAIFEKLNFSFDHYSRTTWEGHPATVEQYFLDLLKNGYVEAKVDEHLYSEEDNKFLADRYVVGTCPKCGYEDARGDECSKCGASYEAPDLIKPSSKLTNLPLVRKKSKHWFLLLDKFKDKLSKWLETKSWKPNVLNFVKSYIDDLKPRAITRDSSWGITVPLEEAKDKVFYVWFDALIGYISASKEWAEQMGEPDLWKKYWCDPNTKLVHFIGKDNIFHHAIMFPAMTMGQDQEYKVVDELSANEFYNLEGRQFSKSDNWYIDLENFFEKYTTDQIRYAIAANAPETSDSEFTWHDFQMRCNAELVGKYGNLINRVLVFAKNKCGSAVPQAGDLEDVDQKFLDDIHSLTNEISISFDSFKLRRACQQIMELSHLGNVYFDHKQPWKDAKKNTPRMQTTISCCLECLKCLALTSFPIIPSTAEKLWHMLGFSFDLEQSLWADIVKLSIPTNQKLPNPKILFQKIPEEQIQQEIESLSK